MANASFLGENADDISGISVAIAGDVNGDGYDDILIGAAYNDYGGTDAGQAYLFFGKSSGWYLDMDLSAASASFIGESAEDRCGFAVSGAGDVNGDGYDDILIGAYFDDDGGTNAGQAYLIFGKASGWTMHKSVSNANASFWGEDDYDYAGESLACAGDVNGDGYDDILIGAPGDEDGGGSEAGQTYLVLGKASGWAMDVDLSAVSASFLGEDATDISGYSVAGAGDVNGDGYDDILIGAYGDDGAHPKEGQTYVVFGKASGWAMDTDLSTASASFLGEGTENWAGYSVAGAGDVNGDGYCDILIGAYGNNEPFWKEGQTYLILGKASGWAMDTYLSAASASFWGEDTNDMTGYRVAGAGDMNGDGFDDFLIGTLFDDDGGTDAGQVYLILGKASGWAMDTDLSAASASFRGENGGDMSGCSISCAGDVNGDGLDDILIGADGDDDGGSSAGQTYLLFPFMRPPAPSRLEARLSRTGGPVTLEWNAPGYWPEELTNYRIYRSEGSSEPRLLSSIPAAECSYVDGSAEMGKRYSYTVVAQYESGELSEMTCTVCLLIEPDSDLDGIGNSMDPDDDGDGILDGFDAAPLVRDAKAWSRTDVNLATYGTSFFGESAYDDSGCCVAGVGDVNGDGYDDILIGACGDDDGGSNAGQAYLVLGRNGGWSADVTLSNASASFIGEEAGDNAGFSVSGAGDVNGDGYDDFLIGAYLNDYSGSDAGQAYLIFGKPSGWAMRTDLSAASASFIGESDGDLCGANVAGAGDVNGDGYDDILVDADQNDQGASNAGQTYLILGKASGWTMRTGMALSSASFLGEYAGDAAGSAIAAAGDVNGDGYDDILIGAHLNDYIGDMGGQTYLVLGKASGWTMNNNLSDANASFYGESAGDISGRVTAGAGDVNGDGYCDILIGAHYNSEGGNRAGQTYLILGKASGWAMRINLSASSASFIGESAGDYSGGTVACAGDTNADGYDDIIIGASYNSEGGNWAGQSYIVLGMPSGWAMDKSLSSGSASFIGEDGGDHSGNSVAYIGDVNGDGLEDILIGAYEGDQGGVHSGQSYVLGRTVLSQVQGLSLNLTSGMNGIFISCTDEVSDPYFYGIYRGAAPDKLYRLATTTASDYTDTNITAGATYYYSVVAVGPLGEESPIAPAMGMVADLDTDGDGLGNMVDADDDNDGTPDGQDKFPFDPTEDADTDLDGTGNNVDTDDDNDGILDASDLEPLNPLNNAIYHLNYANTTLQNVQGTVNTLRTDLASMDGNLTTLTAGFNAANLSLTLLMNGLRIDITDFNQSMQGRLDKVLADMSGLNISLMERLRALDANLSGFNDSVLNGLGALGTDISGMNETMLGGSVTLGDAIALLSARLEEVNASLNAEMEALSAEMMAFRNEMRSDLDDILDMLARMDANLTAVGSDVAASNSSINSGLSALDTRLAGHVQGLSAMLSDLNATTIKELRRQLGELRTSLEATASNESGRIIAKIDTLNGVVGGFQSSANGRFSNITVQMAKLDGIKSDIGSLQTQQEKATKDLGTVNTINIGSLVVMLVLLVLLLLAFFMFKRGTGPSDAPTPPPPQATAAENEEVSR